MNRKILLVFILFFVAVALLVYIYMYKGIGSNLLTFPGLDNTDNLAPVESQIPPDTIVAVYVHGGLCPGGECKSTITISKTGVIVENGDARNTNQDKIVELTELMNLADFSSMRENKFEGTCPIAYDGSEFVYTFYTNSGEERIASCETNTEGNSLIQLVDEIIGERPQVDSIFE